MYVLLLNALVSGWLGVPADPASNLYLKVTHLRNDQGKVHVSLYNSGEGFPKDASKAFKVAKVSIRQGCSEVVFTNLPPGEYAVVLMHDENGNGQMDTNLLGLPKEGFGVSNGAESKLGPPKFRDARFTIDKPETRMEIKAKYF